MPKISSSSHMLSALFLDAEKVFGSRDSCFLAMESMKNAIENFTGTPDELHTEMTKLAKQITTMSPRIAQLIMMTFSVLHDYNQQREGSNIETEKTLLYKIIDTVQNKRKKSVHKLLQYSQSLIEEGDTILLHDISHTVFDVIRTSYERGATFSILVAAQEEKQTETLVAFLQKLHITFTVVPEYLLIHAIGTIDKAFLGAVTINSALEVIADAGSEAIVSQMQYHNIPVYVPITTDKLSLWKAESQHHTLKTISYHSIGGETYNKMIFSHDRYSINQVTAFITNKGILSPQKLKNLYTTYFKRCEMWREKTEI